jgi:hypothetical protein
LNYKCVCKRCGKTFHHFVAYRTDSDTSGNWQYHTSYCKCTRCGELAEITDEHWENKN